MSNENTNEVFDKLQPLSDDADYRNALEVMQNAPEKYKTSFIKTCQMAFDMPHQAPGDIGSEPAPSVQKNKKQKYSERNTVKAFLLITGQTHGAHEQILHQLKAQGPKVTLSEDPQQCDFIFLICPILTRVRSNVEEAFRKIPDTARGKPVILVLLHHTRKVEHVLKESRWKEEYNNIVLEVQALYHESQNGLLQNCPRNQEAIQTLLRKWKEFQGSSPSCPLF